jgi:serine/threonine-protein kinase
MRHISVGRTIPLVVVLAAAAITAVANGAGHPRGTIDTIAGTGKPGFSGDGGPARKAKVSFPRGIAVDRKGNVYFCDLDHDRVRKIDTHGKITTFAGTGKRGYSGDGGPATQAQLSVLDILCVDAKGNIFIADHGNDRIRKLTPNAKP